MSEFKISSWPELKAVIDAVALKPTGEVDDLVQSAKEAHDKYIKTLRKVHKRILQIKASQDQAQSNYLINRSIKTTVVQFKPGKSKSPDIELDTLKMSESGYVSYILQTYPQLFGFKEPSTGIILNFDSVEWYSVVAVCEKHTELAEHVELLQYKDHLNDLSSEKVRVFVYMKNLDARKIILMNFLDHLDLSDLLKNKKESMLKKFIAYLKDDTEKNKDLIKEFESDLKTVRN
jgi:hypothetical protein